MPISPSTLACSITHYILKHIYPDYGMIKVYQYYSSRLGIVLYFIGNSPTPPWEWGAVISTVFAAIIHFLNAVCILIIHEAFRDLNELQMDEFYSKEY